jgi:hypothetical protein
MRGPWDNDILVYRVTADGRSTRLATFERAGVSAIARLQDGRLIAAHQHFPADSDADFDKVAVRFSTDEGQSWTSARVIGLTGLPDGMRFPFDPTLVVLPDGRIRLYFTSLRGRRFDEDLPAIYSAVSTNGIDFVVEPGPRFGIAGRHVIDSAVALHDGVFHLFAPDNGPQPQRPGPASERPADGGGYHATSRDGLAFTRVDDVRIAGRRRWLGNALSDGSAIRFFGTGEPGVWTATSTDGRVWNNAVGLTVPGADPGATAARGGGWIVTVTGPPRGRPDPRRPGAVGGLLREESIE